MTGVQTCALPISTILVIQFKRFKYVKERNQFVKLDYRIQFPFEIRLPSTQDEQNNKASLYTLSAIIMHMGYGIQAGHYYSIIKIGDKWVEFDDSKMNTMSEEAIEKCKRRRFKTIIHYLMKSNLLYY